MFVSGLGQYLDIFYVARGIVRDINTEMFDSNHDSVFIFTITGHVVNLLNDDITYNKLSWLIMIDCRIIEPLQRTSDSCQSNVYI